MSVNEASRAQIIAADPGQSTWLSANAGSGKTRVLTDRVARLLLEEVPPERILCLTYTKAAASEMQNRLFRRLGEWAMMGVDGLEEALNNLGLDPAEITPDLLSRARTLFARAIETPGGLKIQTIHSFCGGVLRRFPLEAGVSPGFTEMDERAQMLLAEDVLGDLAAGGDVAAVDAVAQYLSGDDMAGLLRALLAHRDGVEPPKSRADIFGWFGIDPGLSAADILGPCFLGGEQALCDRLLPHLDPESRTYGNSHRILAGINWLRPGLEDLTQLEKVFLTGSATKTPDAAKIGSFGNAQIRAAMGADLAPLEDFMLRLEAARPQRRALQSAGKTAALHQFAAAFLPAYDAAKQARGWLDFDDLIRRTRALLMAPGVAQWVLFRLDGGIDHILVDEAQDTAPAQWQIIAKLAEEFAAGIGARADTPRTIFVVGDKKQSIYSFQGADPSGFDRMREHFAGQLAQIGAPFQARELIYSFRSAAPVLALVDHVAGGAAAAGVGPDVTHTAFKTALPGRIDIWPHIARSEKQVPSNWENPVDLLEEDHHHVRLARRVAEAISAMLDGQTMITVEEDGKTRRRAVRAGDILILVQRRSDLFHEMIAAIKAAGLPIAGADRMRVAAELAVKDLIALMAFLATPEDDLSLACVLRSPVLGWSEAALYDLAHGRKGFLWRALQSRAGAFPQSVALLEDLRDRADFLRPYDLLERVLIRHDARRNLLARLGPEAEDGIDAMLGQALAYERMEVPNLTGFVGWLQADDVTIKRDPGRAGNQIRVMSIHGAKGLEAPIVILPDCAQRRSGNQGVRLLEPEGGPLVWPMPKADAPAMMRPAHEAAARAEAEERNRLLYVAMTRAESWLIVAAAGDLGRAAGQSWYGMIRESAEALSAAPQPMFGETGLRLESGDWAAPGDAAPVAAPPPAGLPDWARHPAADTGRMQPARAPSDLGGAKALASDTVGLAEDQAKRRGRLIHLLLEHLPGVAEAGWAAAAPGILALEEDVPEPEQAALLEEASRVLTAPALAPVFAPDTLAEVPLTAWSDILSVQLFGVIDRLIVTETRVLAVDFKSNATVPARAEDVPEGLLRQMGAYAEMLSPLYPGRSIETALLWTRTATLMVLPHSSVMAALQRAASA
ncbi:double-strand break repair helicase AddA [Rhodophyticola sp. CCM32]|uniref:double-strand break repair helicase AddA n=1 Tax=Rhodophyticola sp. CCM32 TaxID=2916397 RepID=UPI00107F0379|nr:double-strand break repair helicase AddA [Rhodophyticola sp. CCM32]QBY02413.1 double-strand break repair helicase AddA [Rhodophyticola sp. CCM32]